MEDRDIIVNGNALRGTFIVTNDLCNSNPVSLKSKIYMMSSIMFQFQAIIYHGDKNNICSILYKCIRNLRTVDTKFDIQVKSDRFSMVHLEDVSDFNGWFLIKHDINLSNTYDKLLVEIDIKATVSSKPVPFIPVSPQAPCSVCSFAQLHEDSELTDFELRGDDGSVAVHRAVLAAASPVLRRMLGGTWREAKEGHVDVPGTSKVTLQNLKDYIYVHTLPDNDLEQLLLLGSYYMIEDLEQKCVDKLVSSLTAENACDLLEFAVKHKATKLTCCLYLNVFKVDQ